MPMDSTTQRNGYGAAVLKLQLNHSTVHSVEKCHLVKPNWAFRLCNHSRIAFKEPWRYISGQEFIDVFFKIVIIRLRFQWHYHQRIAVVAQEHLSKRQETSSWKTFSWPINKDLTNLEEISEKFGVHQVSLKNFVIRDPSLAKLRKSLSAKVEDCCSTAAANVKLSYSVPFSESFNCIHGILENSYSITMKLSTLDDAIVQTWATFRRTSLELTAKWCSIKLHEF